VTRALAASLAIAALAAPSAVANDLRSPSARDTVVTEAQKRGDNVFTGGVRAPDVLAPNARDAAAPTAPTARAGTPDATTVVEVTPARGFDWTSAGLGAGGGMALLVLAIAGTAAVRSRSRLAPH